MSGGPDATHLLPDGVIFGGASLRRAIFRLVYGFPQVLNFLLKDLGVSRRCPQKSACYALTIIRIRALVSGVREECEVIAEQSRAGGLRQTAPRSLM